MFSTEQLPVFGVLLGILSVIGLGWLVLKGIEVCKRRRQHALLAAVVENYIHDRVKPDNKNFDKDISRIAKKAFKVTHSQSLLKKSPEPKFVPLLVGATNKCFRVTYPMKPKQHNAFMRVQGAGSVLSNPREQELAIFQYCSTHNLGPRLYAVFDNGYLAEFMTGAVVSVESMGDPKMYHHIARLVAKWHTLKIPSSVAAKRLIQWKGRKPLRTMSLHANTWLMIDKWLLRAKRLYASEDALALCTGSATTFAAFQAEILSTKQDLLPFYATPSSIVLCHNDLNHGNLLWDEGKQQLLAVDLEFSGINHRGFDLANHFCEWAGLDLHYEKCPNELQMRDWLSTYLDEIHAVHGYTDLPKEQLLDEIVIEAQKWMQASHLFWYLWGMIQIKISNIEGFDAANYSKVRWDQYMKNKEKIQKLKHPQRLIDAQPAFHKTFPAYNPHSRDGTIISSNPKTYSRRRSSSGIRRMM